MSILLIVVCSLTFAGEGDAVSPVSPVMILPFVLLLSAIAVGPFMNRHWWEKSYPIVSVVLGTITVFYYLFFIGNSTRVFHTFQEYLSFIVLIGSLFVISGGIHIELIGKATPMKNVLVLAFGAVIANVIGTTGASVLLIRPFIRVNRYHIKPYHVIFFIFLVSNIGGAMTPIGDPPLFLGYLKGIPFFWILQSLWSKWALVTMVLLVVFFLIDWRDYRHLRHSVQERVEESGERIRFDGMANIGFLFVVLLAVFIGSPSGLRELLMIAAAVGSYSTTNRKIHERNDFNFIPIKEVAFLFLGIFATMMPALDWLTLNAQQIGLKTVGEYFWATGGLSSFLDNAPTYLNFLTAAFGLFRLNINNPHHMQLFLSEHGWYVQSVSIAAVFFGAMTYIGNGPNFMVKSIAEQSGVKMPSFFGYMIRYSLPILLPTFAAVWFFFFHS